MSDKKPWGLSGNVRMARDYIRDHWKLYPGDRIRERALAALLDRVSEEAREPLLRQLAELARVDGFEDQAEAVAHFERLRDQGRAERDAEWERVVREVRNRGAILRSQYNYRGACDEILERMENP